MTSNRAGVKRLALPMLRWAGGKRWALERIRELFASHEDLRLVEPFVGGMSVALGLQPKQALLADANANLINFYDHVRKGLVIKWEMKNEREFYLARRKEFNELLEANCSDCVEAAQLFYYLNATCFNGLYRENKNGLFNVPFGKRKTVNYRVDFSEYADILRPWRLVCYDFSSLFECEIVPGDRIFADPPYDVEFRDYIGDGFEWSRQVELANLLAAHDGPVVATNQATVRILDLYRSLGFGVEEVEAPRSISANGDRKPAMEMIAIKNLDRRYASAITFKSTQYRKNQTENAGENEMADLPADMLDEVGKARVGGGGNYFRHGTYIIAVDKWFYQKIQDRCIILQGIVIRAKQKVVFEGDKKIEDEPNPVGSTVSSTANFDGDGKLSAPANSRAPVLGLFGFKENDVPDAKVKETLSHVTSEKNPARMMLIAVDTFPKEIRSKKGSYITGLDWQCVSRPPEGLNSPAMVAERLAAAAAGPEKLVEVTEKQLQAFGQLGVVSSESAPAPAVTAPAAAPQLPSAPPTLPSAPPSLPAADPMAAIIAAGWQQHPGDPNYMWRGSDLKTKADLLAGR